MKCGIDLGSRSVKVALMRGEKLDLYSFDTIKFYREYGKLENGSLAVDLAGLLNEENLHLENTVSTGYGRQTIKLQGARAISEIKAHVLGAIYLTGLDNFTLLDLGGQDSKAALVRNGKLIDFQTNDKCAASTGRYLENMASVLDINMQELGKYYRNPVELTSTCAIFGETELIQKIAEGHSRESLAAGVNHTIFKRVHPMLVKLKSGKLVFTGGVAYSEALRRIIESELRVEVVIPENSAYTGAIGCCIAAGRGK
ncbi:MAG: acyl-CoA dehydratase activase [Clostridiales bacterium]|nr:acyl-CoA dehydratase activase [Clostridiales bacterium]MCF8023782.1 acyl-CoA dehydratase activase [Clostridiales bacterium]